MSDANETDLKSTQFCYDLSPHEVAEINMAAAETGRPAEDIVRFMFEDAFKSRTEPRPNRDRLVNVALGLIDGLMTGDREPNSIGGPRRHEVQDRIAAARLILDYDLKIRAVRNQTVSFGNVPVGLD